MRHRNISACSESNPVQSSRSKSTSCPRKERLRLRIFPGIMLDPHNQPKKILLIADEAVGP